MYPHKVVSKEEQRMQAKESKRQQLCVLLTNKFRNKFGVNNMHDPEIDQLIVKEINALLADGKTYESNLKLIDRRLEVMIREIKAGKSMSKQSEQVEKAPSVRSHISRQSVDMVSRRSRADQLSIAGSNIISPTITSPKPLISNKQQYKLTDGKSVVYEDPSLALNLTDRRWNQIVQKDFKAFNDEKVQAKEQKRLANLKIYEEQKRQIEEKRQRENITKQKDIDYFQSIGCKASDVYYHNEDHRINKAAAQKGKSHAIAYKLRDQQHKEQKALRQKMAEQAAQRQVVQAKIIEEDIAEKNKKAKAKLDLRSIQQQDAIDKSQTKAIYNEQTKVNDFADHNVFSYVYSTKEHKSHKLRQINDKRLDAIKDQFVDPRQNKLSNLFESKQEVMNARAETSLTEKAKQRKRLEFEAKLFQDQQVKEKEDIRKMQREAVLKEQIKISKDAELYQKQETESKEQRKKKERDHQRGAMEQLSMDPKNQYAKTGVAIINE